MKIALAPVQYFWDRKTLLDFYALAVEMPVDIIYLGETVCSKRKALSLQDWLALAQDIASSGKEVVMSTLCLIEAESELSYVRSLLENFDGTVEANDYAVVQMAQQMQRPICAGSTLNVYNPAALHALYACGVRRWVPPVEMSGASLQELLMSESIAQLEPRPETEVFSYGRLPLAHSARCYTARYENLPKDQCEFRCGDYPHGIALQSQELQPLFQINGIQTQSHAHCNLLSYWRQLKNVGVDILRISVSTQECLYQIAHARNYLDGHSRLITQQPADVCNGYWFGTAGIKHISLI